MFTSRSKQAVPEAFNPPLAPYDTVVEATAAMPNTRGWDILSFYRERLAIPQDAGTLRTPSHLFGFYGRTDFQTVRPSRRRPSGVGDVELTVNAWPRALCTSDGRVYLEMEVQEDAAYIARLPEIVAAAGTFFRTGDFPAPQDGRNVLKMRTLSDLRRIH